MLPHEWAVLTVTEAKKLVEFIDKMTAGNYQRMNELGVLSIYSQLRSFVANSKHYEQTLRLLGR